MLAKRRFIEIVEGITATHLAARWTSSGPPRWPHHQRHSQTDELVGYVKEMLGRIRSTASRRAWARRIFRGDVGGVPGGYLRVSLGSNDEGYTYGGHNPKVCFNEEGACRWAAPSMPIPL